MTPKRRQLSEVYLELPLNICDGGKKLLIIFAKKLHVEIFDRVLNNVSDVILYFFVNLEHN